MRLPLVVACFVAGSTWTFAAADVLTSSNNPKTAQKQGSSKAQTQKLKRAGPGTSASASVPAGSTGGGQHHALLAPPPNDDCSSPVVIAGSGPFVFDTTGASTSVQQSAGCPDATLDVWYSWTAPSSGTATMETCSGVGSLTDTVLAAYAGGVCPAWGTELACNDDSCPPNLSQIAFAVTSGSTYMLQVGGYAGSSGSGSFTMSVTSAIPNDDCATPTVIAGAGPFAFDTTGATTSAQQSGTCAASTIDLWYSWTAPASGACTMSLCAAPGTLSDSVIAAYAGGACPVSGTELACNDDSCAYLSQMTFAVTSGNIYLLQVGGWNGNSGSGSFTLNVSAGLANDDCATPTLIGLGSYPYDNTLATTGAQGQSEALCNWFGGTGIPFDTWYQFTAPASGCTIVDNCGSAHDSKIAVYAGAGCPVAGSALACNDDGCGRASVAVFTASAGQIYTVQLGSYPGGAAGFGTLNVSQPGAAPGNDDCSTPTVVVGLGAFPFDNSAATSSCDGQTEAICAYYSTTSIATDVWFQWTAPSTGFAVMDTCALSAIDSKIAAYLGAGCPTPGSALACADDSCPSYSSTIIWAATAGTTYTLQIGTYPIAPVPGTGFFTLDVVPPPGPCDPLDDGTTENIWSLGGNSDTVWLNRFGDIGTTTTINSVDIMYGSAAFPGSSPANGTPTDILVYADGVSQDGDPTDATLLAQIPSAVSSVDTDTYVTVVLPTPITLTGYFFAGGHEICAGGQWVAPNDEGSLWVGRSWEFGDNTGGVANLANPGASAFPPAALNGAYFGGTGAFCVRVNFSFGPASYTCTPGDPGINLCPGCNNKGATGGASISASGTNSLAAANLVFTTADENPTVGSVLIQGSAFNAGINFGHGVRCAAGVIKRLYLKISSLGSITAPGGGDPSIPARCAALGATLSPGDVRYYQVYYRDTTVLLPGCPVPANQFNVTNAAQVTWQP